MTSYRIEDGVLTVKAGPFRNSSLSLDSLRLVHLMLDTQHRWYVVTSSMGISSLDLDAVDDGEFESVQSELLSMIAQSKPSQLEGGRLALADYDGGSVLLPLKDVKRQNLPIFEALETYRDTRRKRRNQWLSDDSEVEIIGVFGHTAKLNAEGFARGKRKIPWAQVAKIQVETYGIRTDLLVLPRDRSGGIFDFRRRRYSLPFVPSKYKELYSAECFFWMNQCGGEAVFKPMREGDNAIGAPTG
jgi:hypothetical protein